MRVFREEATYETKQKICQETKEKLSCSGVKTLFDTKSQDDICGSECLCTEYYLQQGGELVGAVVMSRLL